MFFHSFIFTGLNIKTSMETPPYITFNELIKNASLKEVPDVCYLVSTRIHDYEAVELWKLHQKYQYSIFPAENEPHFPFLLFPLFKITDLKNKGVHYTFFEGCNINVIYNFGHSVLLGLFDGISNERNDIKMYHGDKEILLNQSTSIRGNGHFIFKDPNSDCAMLYYGVLIDSSIFRSPCCEFTKLYNYYILRKNYDEFGPVCSDFLYPEGITIELQIDIDKLNKSISVSIYNEQEKFNYFLLDLKLNKILLDIGFKVILKGKIINDKLYFEIYKYYGEMEINDVHYTMILLQDEARELYRDSYESLSI